MRSGASRVMRVALFDAYRSLNTWRWFAVGPVFAVGGWYGADHANFLMEVVARSARRPNLWDGALILPTSKYALVFPFVVGFLLITADLYVRDRQEGTAVLTLLRSRSRAVWWAGKVLSIAPAAFFYSALVYLFALAGSALRLPVELRTSGAARLPWGEQGALYPRIEELPVPLFFAVVVFYTAVALWAVGAVALAASALYPRAAAPLAAGLALVVLGIALGEPLTYKAGVVLANPVYHVTYVSNFGAEGGFEAVPWVCAAVAVGGMLFASLVAGALWTRRVDL